VNTRLAKQFDNSSSADFDMTGLYRSSKLGDVLSRLVVMWLAQSENMD
jgi:hypothetical protein